MDKPRELRTGDRIELSGGYDYDPLFLKSPAATKRLGLVLKFIKGQNKSKAAVVRLDEQISGVNVTGDIAVLELRYERQSWTDPSPVHIELCDFTPDDLPWSERRQGEWIESAATLKIL